MARIARVICPEIPHHVTQRGNRRQTTFFCDDDYRAYIELMKEWCCKYDVAIWAWCLMPNHVHLIAIPQTESGRGHLWQGRFASFPMDEPHLLAAIRYIEMNPVAAGLVSSPAEYPWSSACAHLNGTDDLLASAFPLYETIHNWDDFLGLSSDEDLQKLKRHENTGRPLGNDNFVKKVEQTLGRVLRPQKPGSRKKAAS